MPVKIYRLDLAALVGASLNEIAKKPEGVVALLADLECLVTAVVELFDGALKADPERVGRNQ